MSIDKALVEYKDFVDRGVSLENDTLRERLLLASLGLAGETGEVVDHIKKNVFHGKDILASDIVKELGDVLWYYTLLCTTLGIDWEWIVNENVAKLTARYPHKHIPGYIDGNQVNNQDLDSA